MYYELYVDVLFLANFMMDYLVLLTVKKILKCSVTHFSLISGALFGALTAVVATVMPIGNTFGFILFHTLISTCMIKIGLRIHSRNLFAKAFVLLYICSFLFGGIMEVFHPYIRRIAGIFFIFALMGFYLIHGIFHFIAILYRLHAYRCKVTLYLGEKECTVNALIDTGNQLRENYYGKPVSVLNADVAKSVFLKQKIHSIQYIRYHTVGEEEGSMPVIQIDRMCIHRGTKEWIEKPYLALSMKNVTKSGEYEMILNPAVIIGGI